MTVLTSRFRHGVRRLPSRLRRNPAVVVVLVFVVVTVGLPLTGARVLSGADRMMLTAPFTQYTEAGFEEDQTRGPFSDTWDSRAPQWRETRDRVLSGDVPLTGDLDAGGRVKLPSPASSWASPLQLPYYVVPPGLAAGWVKLLELLAASGFTYLFLRRIGLTRSAGWIGGVVFAGSGFQTVWTNWPHPLSGAVIPFAFWAVERLLQLRRPRDLVPVALAVAWSLAGGFPAVTLYTAMLLGPYVVFRLVRIATRERRVLPTARIALAGASGVALGLMLAAPAVTALLGDKLSSGLEGRAAQGMTGLARHTAVTILMPYSLGNMEWGGWFGATNPMEEMAFVGAAACFLALLGVLWRRSPNLLVGVRWFFAAAVVVLLAALYLEGPVLRLLNEVPMFSSNPAGRLRSVLGFALAVSAAVGANALLDRTTRRVPSREWVVRGLAAMAGMFVAYMAWRYVTPVPEPIRSDVRYAVVVAVGAVAAVLVVWALIERGMRTRFLGVALVAIVAAEGLAFTLPFLPRISPEHFYPEVPVIEAAVELQGLDRVEGRPGFWGGALNYYGLRTVTGHDFVSREWREMLEWASPGAFRSATSSSMRVTPDLMDDPLLDRMAVRYVMLTPGPDIELGGTEEPIALADRPLGPGRGGAASVSGVPGEGLRGVVLTFAEVWPPPAGDEPVDGLVVVEVLAGGSMVSRGEKWLRVPQTGPIVVPLEERSIPDGPVTIEVWTEGHDAPASLQGPARVIRNDGTDGTIVWAGRGAVLERSGALPRYRIADGAVTPPGDAATSTDLVAELPADRILVETGAPVVQGNGGEVVEIDQTDPDDRRIEVRTDGGGYLVIADQFRDGWKATVDGAPVEVLRADHALMAVPLDDGRQVVELWFDPAGTPQTLIVAGAALAALLSVLVWDRRRIRSRDLQQRQRSASSGPSEGQALDARGS